VGMELLPPSSLLPAKIKTVLYDLDVPQAFKE